MPYRGVNRQKKILPKDPNFWLLQGSKLAREELSGEIRPMSSSASPPVQLTQHEIEEIGRRLSRLRHNVNNHLSLVIAGLEVMEHRPEMTEKVRATMREQPELISSEVSHFSQFLDDMLKAKSGS